MLARIADALASGKGVLTTLSLANNNLTNGGNLTGVFNLADAVKQSQLNSLSCAAARTCSLASMRLSKPDFALSSVHGVSYLA